MNGRVPGRGGYRRDVNPTSDPGPALSDHGEATDAVAPINEVRGLGVLIAQLTDRIVDPIEGTHRAFTDRAFRVVGASADPVRKVHDGLVGVLYDSIRLAGTALGVGVSIGGIAAGRGRDLRPISRSAGGSGFIATVNGVIGDQLEAERSELSIGMGIRDLDGAVVTPRRDGLGRAFPDATPRLVVMVHGLVETERCWRGRKDDDEIEVPALGERLFESLGFTPLTIRYNTGRRISRNGEDLAHLLDQIVAEWPQPVESIALVGHSMGGLVARSAAHAARESGHAWIAALRHVVTLGTPHLGSVVEKAVSVLSRGLRITAEGRPLADFLDARSVGIKDLRFGAVVEDDWSGIDSDALFPDPVGDLAPVDGVGYHFVAGAITTDPRHPFGVLVGDWMVRVPSGTGRGRRRRVEATNVHVLGGRHHFDLLHDPAVHDQICDWLAD